jgi:hypothetical protein
MKQGNHHRGWEMTSVWKLIQGKKDEDPMSNSPSPRLGAFFAVLSSVGSQLSF